PSISNKHVPLALCASWREIPRLRGERHEAPISADVCQEMNGPVGLLAVSAHAHELGPSQLSIAHEYAPVGGGPAWDQVLRRRREAYEAPVGADRPSHAAGIGRSAVTRNINAFGRSQLPVPDVDVPGTFVGLRDQVGGP